MALVFNLSQMYDEEKYVAALKRQKSPLVAFLTD
jgi:hypothetical protein